MRIPGDWFRQHVMDQIRALRDFIEHSEAQLQEAHLTSRALAETQWNRPPVGPEDTVQEWVAFRQQALNECDRLYTITFPRIMRYSFATMCHTLTESNLCRTASEIKRRKPGIVTSRAKELASPNKRSWLNDIKDLRDCIVHRYGVPRDKDKKMIDRLKPDGIRVVGAEDGLADPEDAGTIFIEAQFCPHVVDKLAVLFREVFEHAGCFGLEILSTEGN